MVVLTIPFWTQCQILIESIIEPRVQQQFSVEHADLYFQGGILSHGFQLNDSSFPFFAEALKHYQSVAAASPRHPRTDLCQLLAKAEHLLSHEQENPEIYHLLANHHSDRFVLSDQEPAVKRILKRVQQVGSQSVSGEHWTPSATTPDLASSYLSHHHQRWYAFSFNYLKRIDAFRSALLLKPQSYCSHCYDNDAGNVSSG